MSKIGRKNIGFAILNCQFEKTCRKVHEKLAYIKKKVTLQRLYAQALATLMRKRILKAGKGSEIVTNRSRMKKNRWQMVTD